MSLKGMTLERKDGTGYLIGHAEAFHLMRYANRATGRREWLWNSRDGVTPFGIGDPLAPPELLEDWGKRQAAVSRTSDYGKWLQANPDPSSMLHEEWGEDSFVPNFIPPLGMRIFVSYGDLSAGEIEKMRAKWDARLLAYEKQGVDPGEEMRRGEPFGYRSTDPVVCVVDEELQAIFAKLCADNPFIQPRRAEPIGGGHAGYR